MLIKQLVEVCWEACQNVERSQPLVDGLGDVWEAKLHILLEGEIVGKVVDALHEYTTSTTHYYVHIHIYTYICVCMYVWIEK